MAEIKEKICSRCRKRVSTKGVASFTGWIFQESICTCARTGRTKMVATQARLAASQVRLASAPALNAVVVDSGANDPANFGDRYQVCELIGSGGMGAVYRVADRELNKDFAIKVLRSEFVADRMTVKRFEQEARTVAALTHPNLVAIYGQGRTSTAAPYLVMDLVVGSSLSDILQREYCLDAPTAMDVFSQVVEALAYAHQKGVVHRDLKPSNILICSETGLVKLVDFGIAKLLPTNEQGKVDLTQTGDIFGSPLYMSPEQCQGDSLDIRSDIYSMGCVMYETVCGVPPFSGANPVKVILAHLNEKPKRPSQTSPMAKIPNGLEKVILLCLEKNPEKRYQSMDDLGHDLDLVSEGRQPIVTNNDQTISPKTKRMLMVGTAIICCVITALIGMAVFIVLQPQPSSEPRVDHTGFISSPSEGIVSRQITAHLNDKEVSVSNVTDKDLESFDQFTTTYSVSINNSDIKGPGLAHLIHLPLTALILTDTHLTTRGMSEIKNMVGLEFLSLSNTGIKDSDLEYLVNLKNMQVLFLSNNQITGSGLRHLLALNDLMSLSLGGNAVSAEELKICGKMASLQSLSLNETNVTDDMLKYLSTNKNLQTISLAKTKIDDEGIAEIAMFPKIDNLDLRGTQISNKSLQILADVKSLKSLDVSECKKITVADIVRLKKKNSALHITWTAPNYRATQSFDDEVKIELLNDANSRH